MPEINHITYYTPNEKSQSTTIALLGGGERTGLFFTTMNLMNSLLGVGVLSVANSMTFCGVVPSLVVLTIVTIVSLVSAEIIIQLHMATGVRSVDEMATMTGGKICRTIVSASCVFFSYSCLIAYLIMGSDLIVQWTSSFGLDLSSYWKRAGITLAFSICFPVALTLPRRFNILNFISIMSFISLAFYFLVLNIRGFQHFTRSGFNPTVKTSSLGMNIFTTIAMNSLAFALAGVIIPVITPAEKNLKLRQQATAFCFMLSYLIVMIPGLFGYLMFGEDTQSNLMLNFPSDDILFIIVQIAFFIVLVAAYPVLGLTIQKTFAKIIYKNDEVVKLPFWNRLVVLILENAPCVIIAMLLPVVRPVIAIGGALGGGISNFVFPPMALYILSPKKPIKSVLLIIYFVCGIIVSALGTYQSVVDAIYTLRNL